MGDGLRVAQLGFCLVLHAASSPYARFRQVGSAARCNQPQPACADSAMQALAECCGHTGRLPPLNPALKTYPPHR
ncbi:hypothetical protein AOQ84DRAFT_355482 [Glonium stellatum]|uniref:Uncharacterized protein n=1 Tax=Glonium stellatum TaxID=574774 RepID=A0A8E2JR41_9PEZI|nr:hypothetical protein AOQ84DRAFT_355482 [Glonium stellatum]